MKRSWAQLFLAAFLCPLFFNSGQAKIEVKPEGFYLEGSYFFPVGVNYMPADAAIMMWKQFDPDAIRVEFQGLRAMGLNTVRTFIFWSDLNPQPGVISERNLDQIGNLLDLARDEGLMVILTLNTGHMSGGNWYPKWIAEWKDDPTAKTRKEIFRPPSLHVPQVIRDLYQDQLTLDNALLMCRALAERFSEHPALLYWDLGNEPQYWFQPPTPEIGQRYVKLQVDELKKYDPNHPVALGMGKFAENTGFHSYGEFGINQVQDLYLVHTYPAGYYPQPLTGIDRYVTYFAGFENRLSQATGQPLQFQEFGMSDLYFIAAPGKKELYLAGYYRTSIWASQLSGARAGVIAWMSNDYKRGLFVREPYFTRPYELDFGVVDQHYRLKASGRELGKFAEIAAEVFQEPPALPASEIAIVLPENYLDFPEGPDVIKGRFQDTSKNHNRFLFSTYLTLRQLGLIMDFITPDDSFEGRKLIVVLALSPLSRELTKKLEQAVESGGFLYIAGYHVPPELREHDRVMSLDTLLELKNAIKPREFQLAVLGVTYMVMAKEASIQREADACEPFVEAGFIESSPRLLVLINHLEIAVSDMIRFEEPLLIRRCFYGLNPPAQAITSLLVDLPAFGVEVCEVDSPRHE